jgi:NitT/TauT family transport system substrate-binding protein
MSIGKRRRRRAGSIVGAALLALLSACAHAATTAPVAAAQGNTGDTGNAGTPAAALRLGYFANVTHTTPIVGVAKGFFAAKLGPTRLSTQIFNAGPEEMTALLSGQLDAAYVGPSSALNAFVKSHGQGLVIVAGAESAGAELVVSPKITSYADLRGKTVADPQQGNTQDVALRYWLKNLGYTTTLQGSGDVNVQPTDNSTTLALFKSGRIDAAWVPEPWASRLVVEGGGQVLVDERSLWPNGQFATTVLVVAAPYLAAHPQTVKALISGQVAANAWVDSDSADAEALVNAQIAKIAGTALKPAVMARAWTEESVSDDPLANTLQTNLDHAVADGLLKSTSLQGIVDLTALNGVLASAGQPPANDDGLGTP